MKRGGSAGKTDASAVVTASANSFSVEEEDAARTEHATGLREGSRLVGEEHGAELAHDGVERAVRKGQLHRVRRAPLDRARGSHRRGLVQHGLIQIRGHDRCSLGQLRGQGARDHAGPGRHFENARGISRPQPLDQVARVGLEDERHEVALVELRDEPGKGGVAI
jgi:hypothetical protein